MSGQLIHEPQHEPQAKEHNGPVTHVHKGKSEDKELHLLPKNIEKTMPAPVHVHAGQPHAHQVLTEAEKTTPSSSSTDDAAKSADNSATHTHDKADPSSHNSMKKDPAAGVYNFVQ